MRSASFRDVHGWRGRGCSGRCSECPAVKACGHACRRSVCGRREESPAPVKSGNRKLCHLRRNAKTAPSARYLVKLSDLPAADQKCFSVIVTFGRWARKFPGRDALSAAGSAEDPPRSGDSPEECEAPCPGSRLSGVAALEHVPSQCRFVPGMPAAALRRTKTPAPPD